MLFRFRYLIAVMVLAGCASGVAQKEASKALDAGIKSYENGQDTKAAKQLRSALDMGLSSKADQVKAHKYLAFINCAAGREKQCRDEFGRALDLDPNFELTAAEAGHPIWGPVYRSLKVKKQK
ncbi:MAG: TssQ family T6SS-associated lipoprotein [Burkholderiales bacterium]